MYSTLKKSLLACQSAWCLCASAAVLNVMPDGDDSRASGSLSEPFGSVQEALNEALAGDTVRVHPGIYYEHVQFRSSGEFGEPVTLEGMRGAVLDGSYQIDLDWELAPDVGPGVWRASVSEPVRVVVANGKSVTMLRDDWVRVGSARAGKSWEYPQLFKNGVGPSGWDGVRALALYRFREKELLIRFQGDLDPREMDIAIAPDARQPLLTIDGYDRCVVRGLTLRNAGGGVLIRDSLGSVIEDCIIGPVEEGVRIRAGADRATIRFNEIFWNPWGENRPKADGAWDHWTAHKRAGWSDKHAISIWGSSGGHQVHDNLIRNHWDGISVGAGDPEDDPNLNIHHNRITVLVDDGIETNGAQVNCQWHDNIIDGVLCAVRLKAPDYGPFYVYRNILFNNRENIRNFGKKDKTHRLNKETGEWETTHAGRGSPEVLPAIAYIYHNTSDTSYAAIVSNGVYGIGVPNYHYYNNLFWCDYWFAAVPSSKPSIDPNWQGDYNVYVRKGDDRRWETGMELAHSLGIDANGLFTTRPPGFVDPATGDYALKDNSPAIGRGVNLSTFFGDPLPGCEHGYYKGQAPDAGAIAYGMPMPTIPRLRESVDAPAAGMWPDADATQIEHDPSKPEASAIWEK